MYSDDPKARLILTVFSALAQEEIRNLSENIQWGIRRSFMDYDIKYTNIPCYGYRRDEKNELTIEPVEAAIIQGIYQSYLSGISLGGIASQLFEMGVPSPSRRPRWGKQSISYVLSNEKYMGDVMLQKTIVKELYTGTRMQNIGQQDRYVVEDNHVGIISKELFTKVQDEKKRRSNVEAHILPANDNDATICYRPLQPKLDLPRIMYTQEELERW